MNKTSLIIGREYFSRVKKKSFLLTTILVPVIFIAFYAIIIAISIKGDSKATKLAIIDQAGIFSDSSVAKPKRLSIDFIKNETEESFIKKYTKAGYCLLYTSRCV